MAFQDFKNNTPDNGDDAASGGIPGIGALFPGQNQSGGNDDEIKSMLTNYNEKFQAEPPALFRDEIIDQSLSILISKAKPNLLLVGQAGVGKTRIVEEIARLIESKSPRVPDILQGYTVYELHLSHVIAGTSLHGSMEQKVRALLHFLKDPKNKAILFIDEVHQLCNERGSGSYSEIAQMLKPALARGQIRMIGATTVQETKNFLRDPAFSRRFNSVSVPELTREQAAKICENAMGGLYAHYKVQVSPALMSEIVSIADEKKKAGMHRPDNALTLFDRAMADALMDWSAKKELAKTNPDWAAYIQNMGSPNLTHKQLKKTAHRLLSGNESKMAVDQALLSESLEQIKGQDAAIGCVKDVVARRELEIMPQTLPETILFCGSSGTGKTETAKIIARTIMGTKPIILNMAEYNDESTINKIIGSPPGYVGSDRPGELPFDALETNPYQVILLDEFEKCCRGVQRLFMSAFDEGWIKSSKGAIIDFSKAIIIATTNAGQKGSVDSIGFIPGQKGQGAKDLIGDFDKELLNRFRHIVYFGDITKDVYKEVVKAAYEKMAAGYAARNRYANIPATLDSSNLEKLANDTYQPMFGCRPAWRTAQIFLEDLLLGQMQQQQQQAAAAGEAQKYIEKEHYNADRPDELETSCTVE